MAEVSKAAEKASPKVEQKPLPKVEPKVKRVRAIYGRMVDMANGEEYNTTFKVYDRETTWVDSQVSAGKMEFEV